MYDGTMADCFETASDANARRSSSVKIGVMLDWRSSTVLRAHL